MHTVKRIRINQWLARNKKIPREFVGLVLRETHKGIYLYGRGTIKAHITCMFCGRALTHEISRYLGMGPICGDHGYDLEMTEENREELARLVQATKIDGWFPRSGVEWIKDSDEIVDPPKKHSMLQKKGAKPQVLKRVKWDPKEKVIRIFFPYDKHEVGRVKTLHGRKWDGDKKHWTTPFALQTIQQLREWGFTIDPVLLNKAKESSCIRTSEEVEKDLRFKGLNKKPYPFQKRGVAFLESRNGRALIGDEMGLGKTMQALLWLKVRPEVRPAIIVCPSTLKENWRREIIMWMGDNTPIHIVSGRPSNEGQLPRADIYIVNYDIISETNKQGKVIFRSDLANLNPKGIILDECHYIKNRKAKRTKAILEFAKNVKHRIALSGTPIINRPVEFFNTLAFIAPERFVSFWAFAKKYCGATRGPFGWDFTGATNLQELNDILTNTIMIRRTKAEVLPDLPAKVRSIVPVPMTNPDRYEKLTNEAYNELREILYVFGEEDEWAISTQNNSGAEALTRIERLKQAAVAEKLPAAITWIRDYLEESEKLVVYTTHQKSIDTLMSELAEFNPVAIDGRTPQKDRADIVDRFQNNPACKLFVGNIKAAGVGITLTAANAVAFLEMGWTPGEHDQAEDRIHRIGQTADSIMAYYLVAQGTIEEEIANLLDSKRAVLEKALDGREVDQMSLLGALLKMVKKEIE